jgi:sugar lactone lactonase YvrE
MTTRHRAGEFSHRVTHGQFRRHRLRPLVILATAATLVSVIIYAPAGYAKTPASPIITTIAGTGTAGYSGDSAKATLAELDGPCGLAVDHNGNILFSDTNNNVVRAVAGSTGEFYGQSMTANDVYTIVGDGTSGYLGDGGPPGQAQMSTPDGLSVDAAGDVIISDTANEIVRFIPAASGTYFGIDMIAGNIYTVAGNTEFGFQGNGGQATSAELGLDVVTGVAVDAAGNLVVTDGDNNVIWVVANRTGEFYGQAMTMGDIYIVAGTGAADYKGDKGPAIKAALDEPEGLAIDGAGNLVFVDDSNAVIRVVAAVSGSFYGKAMTAGDIYTVGPKSEANTLNTPEGLTIDPAGNIVFADAGNNVVYLLGGKSGTDLGVKVKAGHLYTVAGNGTAGYMGDGGKATAAELNGPCAVASDAQGHLYIADGVNNVIREAALP